MKNYIKIVPYILALLFLSPTTAAIAQTPEVEETESLREASSSFFTNLRNILWTSKEEKDTILLVTLAKPSSPEPAKPSSPEPVKPSSPEPVKPSFPELVKPSFPEPVKPPFPDFVVPGPQ